MYDKAKLGTRYTCFKCGTKFYDLNRPVPTCPECQADQSDAPVMDIHAMLSSRGRSRRAAAAAAAAAPEPAPAAKEESEEEDEEDLDDVALDDDEADE